MFANCVQSVLYISVYTLLTMFHYGLKYLLVKRNEHDVSDTCCACVLAYLIV